MFQSIEERCLLLVLGNVAFVACDAAKVRGFPVEKNGEVGFRKKKSSNEESEDRNDEGNPFRPPKVKIVPRCHPSADNRCKHRSCTLSVVILSIRLR